MTDLAAELSAALATVPDAQTPSVEAMVSRANEALAVAESTIALIHSEAKRQVMVSKNRELAKQAEARRVAENKAKREAAELQAHKAKREREAALDAKLQNAAAPQTTPKKAR